MNILYLTSEYKDDSIGKDDPFTYISNSFCKKWITLGHNVVVIHNSSLFFKIIYFLPKFIKKFFERRIGYTWGGYNSVCKKHYNDKGVNVYREPIKKIIPHSSPSKRIISRQVKIIRQILFDISFNPDVIIGQWGSPQTEIISNLKKYYSCPTSVVFHGYRYINRNNNFLNSLQKIDKIGARSKSQSIYIKEYLKLTNEPFVCYSGVPDSYLDSYKLNLKKFDNIKKWRFAFVGRLVDYKKADIVIKSLAKLSCVDWELSVVGEGAQLHDLVELSKSLGCAGKIRFYGKISRDEVMEILSMSHCFIMASVGEVFGLVYLEAMGASCLTVASRNGGIDGVIENDVNGFLIGEGDEAELYNLLQEMVTSNVENLKKIASNGFDTANKFSETQVAIDFLEKSIN